MDFAHDRPIYLQIADDVRKQILTGVLAPGNQLMSTTHYATEFRINPATANKAFAVLVEEGVIEKRRGIGMFVTHAAPQILRSAGRTRYIADVLGPALDTGLMLGFTPTELVALTEAYCSPTSPTSTSPRQESQ